MVQLTSSLVSLLLLACSFELAAAYKAPKISNDTDDDVNLSIVNGKITDYHMFPFISYLFARKDPSSIWGSACTGKLKKLGFIIWKSLLQKDQRYSKPICLVVLLTSFPIYSLHPQPIHDCYGSTLVMTGMNSSFFFSLYCLNISSNRLQSICQLAVANDLNQSLVTN